MPGYYVTIDGKRYDRALLDAAEAAISKPGDGRISKADAERLAALALDGKAGTSSRYTTVERDTIARIRATTKWTGAADRAFLAQIPDAPALKPWQLIGSGGVAATPDYQPVATLAQPILAARGIPKLAVKIDANEVAAQTAAFGGTVTFADALDLALASILKDGSRSDSPFMMVEDTIASEGNVNGFTDPQQAVQDLLNRSTATLQLVSRSDMTQPPGGYPGRVFPPEDGEKPDGNWLFALHLDFSDVLHWAVVDRTGATPPYNYGFN